MAEYLDTGVVLAIVAVAAVYVARRLFRGKDGGCGCGCSGCPSAGSDGCGENGCGPDSPRGG